MADDNLKQSNKSDQDSEGSLIESDVEAEDVNKNENNSQDTPVKSFRRRRRVKSFDGSEDQSYSDSYSEQEDDVQLVKNSIKDTLGKVAEGSEYESAEETNDKAAAAEKSDISETPDEKQEPEQPQDVSSYELVDEEGGEEDIADVEEVDLLSGDAEEGDEDEDEEDSEGGEYVEEERQQGDGEECSPDADKELDFDEDRRNPQYIPKKGIFYEHDDRNNEELKEKEEEPPIRDNRKKKLWLDEGKWGHDRFREEEQFPKSRNELIDVYGYDIRNEDGPPRARRRRRYGRGPSKYERNWEDSFAYAREKFRGAPDGLVRGRRGSGRVRGEPHSRGRGRGPRPFNSTHHDKVETSNHVDEPTGENEDHAELENDNNTPVINTNDFPALPTKEHKPPAEPLPEETSKETPESAHEHQTVRTITFENSTYSNRNSVEREPVPPRRGKTPPFGNGYDRGSRRPGLRGSRGSRGDFNRRGRGNMRHVSPRFMENKINKMNSHMEHLSLLDNDNNEVVQEVSQHIENNNICEEILPSVPTDTELQNMALKVSGDTSGRPKRYSSLRQRSLPETASYQAPPPPVRPVHPQYYETNYSTTLYAPPETCVPTPSTQSQTVTNTPLMNYQTFTPPPYTDNFAGLRMPVTHAPPPARYISVQAPVTVPAAPPTMAPPPSNTPIPNTVFGFAPPPPPTGYHQFAPPYQQYTTPPPPPPPAAPPSELYQQGITYYYPPSQPPPIRPTVQKRPKAAIPIVPPPERESKRNEKKDTKERNHSSVTADSTSVEVIRTDSSQLQAAVGVES